MRIDITAPQFTIQKLTLESLVADAVARKDKEALQWIEEESNKDVTRKQKDGTTRTVKQPVNSFRVAYLEKFCGYSKPAATQRVTLTAQQKREAKRKALFANAMAQIDAAIAEETAE